MYRMTEEDICTLLEQKGLDLSGLIEAGPEISAEEVTREASAEYFSSIIELTQQIAQLGVTLASRRTAAA